MENIEFYEDIQRVMNDDNIPWLELQNKCVFITGGTGLIGASIIYALDCINLEKNLGLKIIAVVRDICRAKERFKGIKSDNFLYLKEGSVECLPVINEKIDYIIHGASQTASKEFVRHAVETIHTSVLGTMNTLELAKKNFCQGYVYLSSMEVYGYPEKGHIVNETEIGTLSPLDLRNSYPLSKILSEAMCCAYASEYLVPAKIIRLTQTYGPEASDKDMRIFAYIANCVREKQNIVLKTSGQTERAYLLASDAVTAILTVLLKGESGKAYNAADDDTYCSIAEMAERIAKRNNIKVEYDIQKEADNGFPKPLYMKLNTNELRKLGWRPMKSN